MMGRADGSTLAKVEGEMTLAQWFATYRHEDSWREGQTWFNLLHLHRPDLADRVRGNLGVDPFYRDEYLPAFFAFVVENW